MAKKNVDDGATGTKKKAECPIKKDDFLAKAKAVAIETAGQKKVASVKEFSTGSFGWYMNDKVVIEVDGVPIKCQMGVNITVVGSKDA